MQEFSLYYINYNIKVFFVNDNDYTKCQHNQKLQNSLYRVDVEVITVQDAIQEYKILHIYDNVETFET